MAQEEEGMNRINVWFTYIISKILLKVEQNANDKDRQTSYIGL